MLSFLYNFQLYCFDFGSTVVKLSLLQLQLDNIYSNHPKCLFRGFSSLSAGHGSHTPHLGAGWGSADTVDTVEGI